MVVASAIFFWVAFVAYVTASCFYAYQFLLRRQKIGNYARLFVILGFIAQTASIGLTSVVTKGTLLTGPNVVILASWVTVFVYFIFELVFRVKAYGAFLIPIAVLLMSVGRILVSLNMEWASNRIFYSTPLLAFHITLLLIAIASFLIGGVSAGLLLYQESLLKNHKSTRIGRRVPSLSTLKRVSQRSILLGFPFLTVGMLIGIVMSAGQNYVQWYFAPRILIVVVLWVVYAIYLLQTFRSNTTAKTSSYVAVLGAVLSVVLIFAVGFYAMFPAAGV